MKFNVSSSPLARIKATDVHRNLPLYFCRLQCDRALLGAEWNGFLVAYHLQRSIGYQQFKILINDEDEKICEFVRSLQPVKDKVFEVHVLLLYCNLQVD